MRPASSATPTRESRYYLKSVALDPAYPQVREYLGEAYVIEGKYDLAKDQLATISKALRNGVRVLRGSGRRADQGARPVVGRPATRAVGFRRASLAMEGTFDMSRAQSTREDASPLRTGEPSTRTLTSWRASPGR